MGSHLYFIVKGPPKKGGGILGMEHSVEAISDPAELVDLITSNAIIVNLTALCHEVDEALDRLALNFFGSLMVLKDHLMF